MKIKTKKGARRLRNQKVRTNNFTRVQSPVDGYNMYKGEVLKVTGLRNMDKRFGYQFTAIKSTGGKLETCLQRECSHIQNKDWIILPNYK